MPSLRRQLDDKLDVITAVDEYVFGYCLHERNNLKDDPDDAEMADYIGALLVEDEYPALAAMVSEMGMPDCGRGSTPTRAAQVASTATSPASWPASKPASLPPDPSPCDER